MKCHDCGTRMTIIEERWTERNGKKYRIAWLKCSKCGRHDFKKLSASNADTGMMRHIEII